MREYYRKKNCRLCKSINLKYAIKFNKSPLCDDYAKKNKLQNFYDLNLCYCSDCDFVQIDTVINPNIIYKNYIYETKSSITLKKHFREYSSDLLSFLNFNKSDLIVDIGSNDGTLLNFFKPKCKILGIEPAKKIALNATRKGIETLPLYFNTINAKKIKKTYGSAKLISINNLFANVDNLSEFTRSLKILLDNEGVIVIESSYLFDMIKNMVFDFIYHEHLSYFSIIPLSKYFNQFGFKLIRIKKVSSKGGSLRYFFARIESSFKIDKSVKNLSKLELKKNISLLTFKKFNKKIESIKFKLNNFLNKNFHSNIIGYGASATTTTKISHFELNKFLKYLVDDNKDKINTYSPGYKIPVLAFNSIKEKKPDIIIIFAWRYYDAIINKLKKNKIKNIQIIVPLPKFRIIKL